MRREYTEAAGRGTAYPATVSGPVVCFQADGLALGERDEVSGSDHGEEACNGTSDISG